MIFCCKADPMPRFAGSGVESKTVMLLLLSALKPGAWYFFVVVLKIATLATYLPFASCSTLLIS